MPRALKLTGRAKPTGATARHGTVAPGVNTTSMNAPTQYALTTAINEVPSAAGTSLVTSSVIVLSDSKVMTVLSGSLAATNCHAKVGERAACIVAVSSVRVRLASPVSRVRLAYCIATRTRVRMAELV